MRLKEDRRPFYGTCDVRDCRRHARNAVVGEAGTIYLCDEHYQTTGEDERTPAYVCSGTAPHLEACGGWCGEMFPETTGEDE